MEKETADHSGVLAWRIPGTAEPGGLASLRSHGIGHDGSDLAAAAAAMQICLPREASDSPELHKVPVLCTFTPSSTPLYVTVDLSVLEAFASRSMSLTSPGAPWEQRP